MDFLRKATDLYKSATATDEGGRYILDASKRADLLEQSLVLFQSELKTLDFFNTRNAVRKNIGMTNLRLAQALLEGNPGQVGGNTPRIIYLVRECVSNLGRNWVRRKNERKLDWGIKLTEAMNAAFDLTFETLDKDAKWSDHLHLLDGIVEEMGEVTSLNEFKLGFHVRGALFYNRAATKLLERNNFNLTFSVLQYCLMDIELGRRCASKISPRKNRAPHLLQLLEIEDMAITLKASCESIRLRTAADNLLQSALADSENLDFDLLWSILDMFKAAANATSGKDIKNETIAIARQAMMFQRVFRLETYAEMYCLKVLEIADIIMVVGRSEKWYWECMGVIKVYQKRQMDKEDEKRRLERADHLRNLAPVLSEIKAKSYCHFRLLKHVYAAHPPKIEMKPESIYDERKTDSSNIKQVLKNALSHFHPDKQVGFGMEWKVLSEEIYKAVGAHYEALK